MAPIKPRHPRHQRPPLTSLRAWCKHNWKNTQRLAQQNSRFTGILLATLALGLFLIVATVRPSSQSCEGSLTLTLATATKLELQFTKFTEQLFWGRLAVKNVKLTASTDSQNFPDNYLESTILAGSVRLADKTASLEANQYLHFNPTNSIDTLLNLSLSEEKAEITSGNDQTLKLNTSAPGLTLDFSGRTERIDIGLNPKNPVIRLQANFLESWIPRDAVIGLIAFLSTLVMTLIGWLWEIATDPPPSS